jgi:hypothetical protein
VFGTLYLSFLHRYLYATSLILRALIPPYCPVEMISKPSIALIILASSLMSSVNAAPIAPARQFLFFLASFSESALLTSNLGIAREIVIVEDPAYTAPPIELVQAAGTVCTGGDTQNLCVVSPDTTPNFGN